ncbi:hypothetical protein C8J57DRAFT_1241516 [Mycena rebaudengoi]|nr:hypothetical protein C8J57DRAFT_1241516 [Mycena rebaudengoi]
MAWVTQSGLSCAGESALANLYDDENGMAHSVWENPQSSAQELRAGVGATQNPLGKINPILLDPRKALTEVETDTDPAVMSRPPKRRREAEEEQHRGSSKPRTSSRLKAAHAKQANLRTPKMPSEPNSNSDIGASRLAKPIGKVSANIWRKRDSSWCKSRSTASASRGVMPTSSTTALSRKMVYDAPRHIEVGGIQVGGGEAEAKTKGKPVEGRIGARLAATGAYMSLDASGKNP